LEGLVEEGHGDPMGRILEAGNIKEEDLEGS
jgi:hypothetical protein